MNRLRQYLDDLLEQIRAIEQFTTAGYDVFMNDLKTQYAVVRAYEIIGEVIKRLPTTMLSHYPDVEWKDVAGFRDFLIHRYDEVDPEVVWGAVLKLPALKAAVEAMLAALPEEDTPDADA